MFNILEEFQVDRKTRELIKLTLTDTSSKVKFLGEISEPFVIKTGVRQGDGLSPLLFNLVLEKVIREWQKETKGINIGRLRKDKIHLDCLAFADDLAILSNNRQEAIQSIEKLHEIAAKCGLQISFEKTQFMEGTKSRFDNQPLITKYGTISQVDKFKYLGEIIQPAGINQEANRERTGKLQRAYKITWNRYNKKSISKNAKLQHYNTVIKPEALYASETLIIGGRSQMKNIEKQERNILRKILGPKFENGIWMKKTPQEIYQVTEKITDTIRKRRLKFYGHIHRMDSNRLTKKILKLALTLKIRNNWLTEIHEDLQEIGIDDKTIKEKVKFRNLVNQHKFAEKPKRKHTGWTEERRKEHSARMKRYWEDKKKNIVLNKFKRAP